MARDDPQMKIRLPEALKTLVEASAKDFGRSLNAEIVHRLEQSFNPQPGQPFDMKQYLQLKQDILSELLVEIGKRKAEPDGLVPLERPTRKPKP